MKTLFLLPFALLTLGFTPDRQFLSAARPAAPADSGKIDHKLDGLINEWPADKFSTDGGTGIQYAMDNNMSNLYLALNIPDFQMQVKMMQMGMSMYVDLKGKKKESRGIDFPVKNGITDLSNRSISALRHHRQNEDHAVNERERKEDMRAIRKLLALNLVEIRLFGLSDKYPDGQQLMLPGSANIAFGWDTSDVMHIEYLVPLTMLGDITSLDQKEINIGWKIHAVEMPKQNEGSEEPEGSENSSMENSSQGSGGNGRYGGRAGSPNARDDREKMMAEQKFWVKYVITLPVNKKAF